MATQERAVDATAPASSESKNYFVGLLQVIFGILALCPDALLLRTTNGIANYDTLFFRGGLMGATVLLYLLLTKHIHFFHAFYSIRFVGFFAGLMQGGAVFLFTMAIEYTEAANALVIMASTAVFATLFSWIFLGEGIPRRTGFCLLISLVAVALIFRTQLQNNYNVTVVEGMLMALGCSVLLGGYFVAMRYCKLWADHKKQTVTLLPCVVIGGAGIAIGNMILVVVNFFVLARFLQDVVFLQLHICSVPIRNPWITMCHRIGNQCGF